MKTALVLILSTLAATAAAQSFKPAAPLSTERSFHTATTLQDGRILVCGGAEDSSCEIYNPATHAFRATAPMAHARLSHTATLLNDGRVLIAGGIFAQEVLKSAEIFDPRTETFSPAGPMTHPRVSHTATLLADGRVLVAGGGDWVGEGFTLVLRPRTYSEIYDPATNSFSPAPDMKTSRWNHTATKLSDGSVLLIGKSETDANPAAEAYGSTAGAIHDVPGFVVPRVLHTTTVLPTGALLVAGGSGGSDPAAQLYDPSTGQFTNVAAPSTSSYHTATLLAGGRVLFTGWSVNGSSSSAAEIYDPATNSISPTASMLQARHGHRANVLPDGTVLITGGNTSTTEIFDPNTTVTHGKRRALR